MLLDAVGKACPIPVILAKKELDSGCKDLTVCVDNHAAVENLTRLANSRGLSVSHEEKDSLFYVRMAGEGAVTAPEAENRILCAPAHGGTAFFIARDHVGDGAPELGYNLLKMALYTLSQAETAPDCVVFMNSGVKLPAGDDTQVIDSLKALIAKGCEVLVCGTCLSFYGLTDCLRAGAVSNMYELLERMQNAGKVISL